jgi:hypothetical protein
MSDQAFEARLQRVLREEGERAVRPVDAAFTARAAVTSQPRRSFGDWRRLVPVLAVALIGTGIVGTLALFSGARRQPQLPAPTLFGAPAVIGADGWIGHATMWTTFESTAQPGMLSIGDGGATAAIRLPDDSLRVASQLAQGDTPGQLRLTLDTDNSGCHKGDVGLYDAQLSTDGLELRLAAITDPCAARSADFGHTWNRNLLGHSGGGRGLVDGVSPPLWITVPVGDWLSISDPESFQTSNKDRTVTVIQDPTGVKDPCNAAVPVVVPVDHGLLGFERYLATIPWLTVVAQGMSVDGQPARQLVISAARNAPCPVPTSDRAIWRAGAPPDVHTLGGGRSALTEVTIVQVGQTTLLVEVDDGTGAPAPDTDQFLASIHFVSGS